jgi:hypothetical protein
VHLRWVELAISSEQPKAQTSCMLSLQKRPFN